MEKRVSRGQLVSRSWYFADIKGLTGKNRGFAETQRDIKIGERRKGTRGAETARHGKKKNEGNAVPVGVALVSGGEGDGPQPKKVSESTHFTKRHLRINTFLLGRGPKNRYPNTPGLGHHLKNVREGGKLYDGGDKAKGRVWGN